MFYFAYGSNLNHKRMKNRCKEAKYLQSYTLKGYKLIFSFRDPAEPYGYANIEKKVNSKVPGAIWKITKKHEKIVVNVCFSVKYTSFLETRERQKFFFEYF